MLDQNLIKPHAHAHREHVVDVKVVANAMDSRKYIENEHVHTWALAFKGGTTELANVGL
jgi:hypothetical protein